MKSLISIITSCLLLILINLSRVYPEPIPTVSLNELTFDKMLSKFPVALVKFDVAFPYGDKYEMYKHLANELSNSVDILVAEVGIKDYGDKENEALALRYKVKKEDFPVLKLFVRGEKRPFEFPFTTDFNIDNIKKFIKKHAPNIYMGLSGCLEIYDNLVKFYIAHDHDRRLRDIEQAELYLDDLENEDLKRGKYYIQVMIKINEKGDQFAGFEQNRIQNILQSTRSLSASKRREMIEKHNILSSFNPPNPGGPVIGQMPKVPGEL